jgi:hypothetical protein
MPIYPSGTPAAALTGAHSSAPRAGRRTMRCQVKGQRHGQLSGVGDKCAHPPPGPSIVNAARNPSREPALTEPGRQGPRPHRPLNRQAITGPGGLPARTGQGWRKRHRRRRRDEGAPLTRAGRPPDNRAPGPGGTSPHAPGHRTPAPRNERPARPGARHHPVKHQARQAAPGSGVRPESGAPIQRTGH